MIYVRIASGSLFGKAKVSAIALIR